MKIPRKCHSHKSQSLPRHQRTRNEEKQWQKNVKKQNNNNKHWYNRRTAFGRSVDLYRGLKPILHARTSPSILINSKIQTYKRRNGDLKLEHKKIRKKRTMLGSTTDIDDQAQTKWNRLRWELSFSLRTDPPSLACKPHHGHVRHNRP